MAPRVFNREEKRDLLVQVAARVFAEQGFASTRVADIATRAGVAKGTMYEYFPSKEELFYAVFEWFNRTIRDQVEKVLAAHSSPREQLIALFRLAGRIIVEHRDMFPMMNVDLWVTSRGSAFEKMFTTGVNDQYREYRELLAGIISNGQDCGDFKRDTDPLSLATVLVSTFDGLGLQYWLDQSIDPVRASERFVLALCRGLCQEDA